MLVSNARIIESAFEIGSCAHAALTAQQGDQELAFPPGDGERTSMNREFVGIWPQDQSAIADGFSFEGAGAAQEGAATGDELVERKGLHEIVVCAGFKRRDPIGNGRAGRDHQDSGRYSGASQLLKKFQAIAVRQCSIENNKVRLRINSQVVGGFQIPTPIEAQARRRQRLHCGGGEAVIVFDEQYNHAKQPIL